MTNVMHFRCFHCSAILFAPLALVTISSENGLPFLFPSGACVVKHVAYSFCAAAPPPVYHQGTYPAQYQPVHRRDGTESLLLNKTFSPCGSIVLFATTAYYHCTSAEADKTDIRYFFPDIFSLASGQLPQSCENHIPAWQPAARRGHPHTVGI